MRRTTSVGTASESPFNRRLTSFRVSWSPSILRGRPVPSRRQPFLLTFFAIHLPLLLARAGGVAEKMAPHALPSRAGELNELARASHRAEPS
uniref:Uncharacterized protein n=1 Tax=Oryza punctata TaxID=4537 RepID=A0A0E0LK19_ORYPU